MKYPIAICTWSLINNLDAIRMVMHSSGLSHLHLDIAAADSFAEAIVEEGWQVTSTMVTFPQEDYSTLQRIRETGGIVPDACWERNRDIALDAIRKTAAIGVSQLSTHIGFIDHTDPAGYAVLRARMLELADAAADAGILLLLETGQESAVDLRHCLEDLNHSALGVNFDPANMILYDKGNPIEAVAVLAPWIHHVHVKDASRTSAPGEWGTEEAWGNGEVPHVEFLRSLGQIDHEIALAIEREAGDRRVEDIQQAASLLKQQL